MSRLQSDRVTLAYHRTPVVHDLTLQPADGQITTIIGPNGCGKSTLLRSLARLMRPVGGAVTLDGHLIHRLPTREVARRLGLLQQQPLSPEGITVTDLARRGRYPHQPFFQPPSARDAESVERALDLTGMAALRHQPVDHLSGGQRQRAWIAMALAQETPLLLLDEPTTYLDLAHGLDILDLVRRLNRDEGRTIVMVLHDINEAARVSDEIVAMRDGRIERQGTPAQVVEPGLLRDLYGVECDVFRDPLTERPYMVVGGEPPSGGAPPGDRSSEVEVRRLRAGYPGTVVIPDLSLTLPAGRVTAIVGANGCGKSTLLRTIGRLLPPMAGEVWVDGRSVDCGSRRAFARRVAALAQGSLPPEGVLVEDLVATGRFPHQTLFRQWSERDEVAVAESLQRCGIAALADRPLETLSGGQRQHAWMAMTLAQDAAVLLLDEPTTFLDIAHQLELLNLIRSLCAEGRTVVMALHDLNLAAHYADVIVAMRDGEVVASGPPQDVLTAGLIRAVFAIDARICTNPRSGRPYVLPGVTVPAHARQPRPARATVAPSGFGETPHA